MQLSSKLLAGIAAAALLVPVGLSAQADKPEVTGKGAGQGSERSAAAKLGPTSDDKPTGLENAALHANENSAVADGIPGGNGPAGEDGEADAETTRKADREKENNAGGDGSGGDGSGDSTSGDGATTDGSVSTEGSTTDALSTLLGATNGNGRGWKGSTEVTIEGSFLAKAISCSGSGFEAEVSGGVGVSNGKIKVEVGILQQKGKPSDRDFVSDESLWDLSMTALAEFDSQTFSKKPVWTSPGSKILNERTGLGGNPFVYIKHQGNGQPESDWIKLGRCNGGMPGVEIPVSWKQPMYLSGDSGTLYCTRTNSGHTHRNVNTHLNGSNAVRVQFMLSKHDRDKLNENQWNQELQLGSGWIGSELTLETSSQTTSNQWSRDTFGGNPSLWLKATRGNSPITLTTVDGYTLPGGANVPADFGYIGRCKDLLMASSN